MKLRMTVILAVLALLPAGYTLGQAIFTEFTGTEMGGGPPNFATTTVNCPGGQPTGAVFPSPCTDGSRVHFRGAKFYYIVQTTDPRLAGLEEVTMNGNFESWRADLFGPGSGQMWGTLVLRVTADEVWEGTWTGTRTVTGNVAVSSIHAVAHGSGGRVEGLTANWQVTLDPGANVGVCQGRILAPPRGK